MTGISTIEVDCSDRDGDIEIVHLDQAIGVLTAEPGSVDRVKRSEEVSFP